MKNKKRKIIFLIILILVILTACILSFNKNNVNGHKSEKTLLESKSNTIKKDKLNKVDEEDKQEVKEENYEDDENKLTENENISSKNVHSNTTNNKSQNNTSNNHNSNNSSNIVTNNNQPTQNNNNTPPAAPVEQQPAVDNRTAWEKLGISEYDYYHTEMYGARVDLYNTDISFCNSEARRILNSYEDVANTRSYSGTGKYTYSYIGCSVDVTFYDGRTVGYNEAKRILGF